MKKESYSVILLFASMVLLCFNTIAQSAKIWNTKKGMISIDSNHIINNHYLANTNFPHAKGAVLSTAQGIPLFVANKFNIQSLINGDVIANSDSMVFENGQNAFFQRNDSVYDLLYFFSKQEYVTQMKAQYIDYKLNRGGYLFDDLINYPDGYYTQGILVNKEGVSVIEKNKLVLEVPLPTYTAIHSIIRISDYSYRIIGHQTENFLVSMKFENGILSVEDGTMLPEPYYLFNEPIPITPSERMYHKWSPAHITINFRNDKVFYIQRIWTGKDTLGGFVPFYEHMSLFEMDMDPKTGKFLSIPKEIYSFQEKSINWIYPDKTDGSYHYLHKIVISPNDSVLYFLNTKENVVTGRTGSSSVFDHEIFTYRYRNPNPKPELLHTFTSKPVRYPKDNLTIGMQLSPFGKVAFLFYNGLKYQNVKEGKKVLFLNETNNPKKGKLTFIESIRPVPKPFIRLYEYQRFHQKIELSCSAKVTIHNTSDFSGGMDSFLWVFTLEDGSKETTSGISPIRHYSKSGNYPYRVRGYSSRGNGYGEIYFDTIKVVIPSKPKASFTASESVICRYLPITFKNLSSSKDTNPDIQQYWEWDFGDGTTIKRQSFQDEIHAYQDTGEFTVSLYYFNGYCDSLLVKKDLITVIDAPRSGFTVSDTIGCAPFIAHFTDTIWRHVKKKEYFFEDSNKWVPINSTKFSHLFSKAGDYKVVQRLHGLSGCIITTDSLNFHIRKGIVPSDSVEILNASYESNNYIRVIWTEIDAAATYEVYRNEEFITTTLDTFYVDWVASPSIYSYHIIAKDSCNTASKKSRNAVPIFLSGIVHEFNKYSILKFTSYKGWDGIIEYELMCIDDNALESIQSQNDTSDFIDNDFFKNGIIEKCYKVKGTSSKNGTITFSNEVCLPYVPIFFAPNAITVNEDSRNDTWKIHYRGFNDIHVTIFNRWGESVYSGANQEIEWAPDTNIPIGVYVYLAKGIDADGVEYSYRGTITLLR